jgi:putative CocE/NonD family hydrolase
MLKVRKETAFMLTHDRVRLDATVYRPDTDGTFPVLLMRQPYGRAIASTVVYAHPTWYAAQGYIVVIQDVRGRGTSEGEFQLFVNEIADGYDTVIWAGALPGSNGAVGMYGFSYQGMTQLYAAADRPAPLKTLCPAMIAFDLYQDWAYEGGAFCLQANLAWGIQLEAETARLAGNEAAHQALMAAAKNLPLGDRIPARPEILQTLAPDSFYHQWLDHPEPGEFWDKLSPKTYLQAVDLPMLHIGGWSDIYLRGTLQLYTEMAARSQHRQQLLVGAWAHLPWGRKVGATDFGATATSPCDRLQLRWFDHFLKGKDSGLLTEPPVQLFEIGSNRWRSLPTWSAQPSTPFYLGSTGLANLDDRAGTLDLNLGQAGWDTIVHDPWRPVPALGGHAVYPSGMQERSSLDCRTDILTYTSAVLEADLHLAGEITAMIYCTADTSGFDLCAVLSEVNANGQVHNLSQGYVSVRSGQSTHPITVKLQPICACIQAGKALRLSLSAACFPAYPVNSGLGLLPGETRLVDQQIITVTVESGGDRPSHLLLPIVARTK